MTVAMPSTIGAPSSHALVLSQVSKHFGGTAALTDASLSLEQAEIHALVGENGAGKSTLINVATGVHQPDAGEVIVLGGSVRLHGPRDATEHGIAVVHQERNLVPRFSVAENLFLGFQPRSHGLVRHKDMARDAKAWLERVGLEVAPGTEASRLSPGQAQLLEIARALARRCDVLLLDEPTSSITDNEVAHLVEVLQGLRASGTALMFVSHKLEEVYTLCDRVTVLRDGRTVLCGAPLGQVSRQEIVHAMVGRQITPLSAPERPRQPGAVPLLALDRLSTEHGHSGLSLQVHRGEIVGLYGLVGSGRTELARAIVGLARVTGGTMYVQGQPARPRNPFEALRRYRIGYVSEDRKGEGLILAHPIERNIGITIWDRVAGRSGLLSDRKVRPKLAETVKRLDVHMRGYGEAVGNLSGGNQQKISAAKWIVAGVDTLVFDEPTVGIDVASKDAMHRLLLDMARDGTGLLVISSDLREVIDLSDRVLVMNSFQLVGQWDNSHSYDEMSKLVMGAITGAAADDHLTGAADVAGAGEAGGSSQDNEQTGER